MARRARSKRSRNKDPKAKKVHRTKEVHEPKKAAKDTVKKTPQGPGTDKATAENKVQSGFKNWWDQNRTTVLILFGIFVLAFLMREFFYYQISFNTWPPNIVGNDPSYHKRVIDFVQEDYHHIRIDDLLNYPLSGGNPRPPIFDWSIALTGIAISPLFGFNVNASTWFVFQFAPTFWGAITIIPMYLLGKEIFGRKAGIMAALLLAITASHIERSTLGFTDHDSFVVFFVVLTMYFLSKSFSVQKERNYISDWRRPNNVILGFRTYFIENKQAMLYASLTGISMTIIALTWQGYGYVLAILLIYYLVQLLLHRFRNEDSLGTFMVMYIAMGLVVLLSLPYYYSFTIAVWSQGFYIFLAMTMLGLFIVPTRDIPWLIVIPTLALFLGAAYGILSIGFPETADLLFTGGGYFVSNKLYDTIAEAQAPELSRIVFTFGPGTFFLALIGVVMAFVKIPRNMRKDYIVIVVWTAVAIFMAMSATRFNFNATPAFALLAGWVLVTAVKWMKAESLAILYSVIAISILLFGLGIVYEGWSGPIIENYMLITVGGTVLISLGLFGFMKYKRNREWFKFRKVIAGLTVGFMIIMPNVFFAVDASIPIEMKGDFDPDYEYLGSFGSSLHSEYWMDSYQWLAEQDLMQDGEYQEPEDRPGFMSWWDYGFDQLLLGMHPTAADNFQNGYHFTGSMIASQNETEAISLMVARILEGDFVDNKADFSSEIWDILVEHLGDDKNSTWSAWEVKRIYQNSASYIDDVEDNPEVYGNYVDMTWQNARYAATRVLLTRIGEEGVVNLYDDITKETDTSLRYFAVDYRLFPFSSSNTGIFYAPITLADRTVDDYLEYKVYAQENTRGSNEDPVWTDYPDNPISMDKAQEEAERLGYKFRIVEYDMFYTDMFYNSLFYRTYIGWGPDDVGGVDDGKSVPAMFGELQNMPAMQAWNMTHFKLVYRTMYYSELDNDNATFPESYDPLSSKDAIKRWEKNGGDLKSGLGQGTFYIKYFHGALLSGRVRTENGIGVPGVRVTLLDDYGIPHGNVVTGTNGEYEMIAPPGDVTLLVSTGDLMNQYDKLYQFQVDQSTGQPMNAINSTKLTISDDQAMRRVDGGEVEQDLVIRGMTIGGNVYWDTDDDSVYTEGSDSLITKGTITFIHTKQDDLIFGPFDLDENGFYVLEDLVPGKFDIRYDLGSRSEILISDFVVDPLESGTRDIRLDRTELNGFVSLVNGVPMSNSTLILTGQDGEEISVMTDSQGNYSLKEVFPGIYELKYDDTIYYHDPVKLSIGQGETITNNITLVAGNEMLIRVRYPSSYDHGSPYGKPAKGAVVTLIMSNNVTRSWTGVTNDKGEVLMDLPVAQYDIQIHSIEREDYWSYLGTTFLYWDDDEIYTPVLEPGFRVSGVLTKLVDNPHNNTEIRFVRISDGVTAHSFSKRGGEYSIYLPKAEYGVVADIRTEANVSYFHMQRISPSAFESDVELDLWTPKTVNVSGKVYWDKDGNAQFTTSDDALQDGDLFPQEFGYEGAVIEFTYPNGSLEAFSDIEGNYIIELPPGNFEMAVEVDGFDRFVREVEVIADAESLNVGVNGVDAMLQAKTRALTLDVFYQYFGEEERINISISDLEVRLITTEPYMGDKEISLVTDNDGKIYTEIAPGEYFIELSREYENDGISHSISYLNPMFVPPGSEIHVEEIVAEHMVTFKGTMFLEENDLIRYPAEMSVNILAIQGMRVTLDATKTDFNGRFTFNLPAGDYVIESHNDRPASHYMLWEIVRVDDDLAEMEYQLVEAIPVDGDITPSFDGVKDSELYFENGNLWTSAGISEDGHFSLFLFPDQYRIVYHFQTQDNSVDGGYLVEYRYAEEEDIFEGTIELEISPEKWIELQGAVYHDINDDRNIHQTEKISGVNITFTPMETGNDPIYAESDVNGDYRMLVPFDRIQVTVDLEGYMTEPREDLRVFDLLDDPLAFRDIAILPEDVIVEGFMFLDQDGDGSLGEGEPIAPGLELTFTEDDGSKFFAVTGSDGSFNVVLPPGIYGVFGMRYQDGQPAMGYLNELNVDMGQDLSGQEWPVVPARRFTGALFYEDTDGNILFDLPTTSGTIDFFSIGRSTIEARYQGSTFRVDLPYYEYSISSDFWAEEYDMEMKYSISRRLTVNNETGPSDLSLEFVKAKEYTFNINLVNDFEHEIEMGQSDTTILRYYIENAGNEPYTVSVISAEKPDGWTVDLPDSQDIYLEIGEKVFRQLNITTPKDPSFTNSLKFEGESDMGSKNTFQVQVGTPPSYRFAMSFDIPEILGVGYGETRVFNLTVQNVGSGEDVVNVQILPKISEIEGWLIEWEGDPEFSEYGENVSLTPRGQRRFAITVHTPDVPVEDQLFRENLKLTFVGKNRQGDVVKEEVSFDMVKPNLVLPSGYLKLSNRRLDDPTLDRTIEANITVRSLYKDASQVNVSLKVDGDVVAEGLIPYIPQDGTGSVRVRFNITEYNITEDAFHTFEVLINPYNTVEEKDIYDNVGIWYDVAVGETPEEKIEINWRIVIFIILIIVIALGVIAYRQKNEPI